MSVMIRGVVHSGLPSLADVHSGDPVAPEAAGAELALRVPTAPLMPPIPAMGLPSPDSPNTPSAHALDALHAAATNGIAAVDPKVTTMLHRVRDLLAMRDEVRLNRLGRGLV